MTQTHKDPTAVIGGSGFIGAAVLGGAVGPVRGICRTAGPAGNEWAAADVRTVTQLREALAHIGSIIHCAAYVGADIDRCEDVNVRGAANVLQVARELGIGAITYVSTSGVYGAGPNRGLDVDAPTSPASATSTSRLKAEELVLRAGGRVIRPHLVYGPGDRRVLPAILSGLTQIGGLPGGGSNVVSMIDVRQLAAQIWSLHGAVGETRTAPFRANANSGKPVPVRSIRNEVVSKLGINLTADSVNIKTATLRLRDAGFSDHQALMLTADDWFRSRLEWREGVNAPSSPANAFVLDEESVEWYRKYSAGRLPSG